MSKNRVQAAVFNNMGNVRRNNEDNFYLNGRYMPLKQMDLGGMFTCEGAGAQMYAVCDGMGGGEAGEEASCMVVEALDSAVRSGGIHSVRELVNLLQKTSNSIHRRHTSLTGSTIAMLVLENGHVLILNIGDSRIYRLRNGHFKQISMDHVGVQAHSITQYLGMPEDEPLEPHVRMDDVGEWTIGPDDDTVYLLCSDGLTDMVPNTDIRAILLQHSDPADAARTLAEAALRRGGKDNVTVMVVRVPQDMITNESSRRTSFWMTMLQAALGACAVYTLFELLVRLINIG